MRPGDEIVLSRELVVTAVRHEAHGAVAGLPGVGTPPEAEGRVPAVDRRPDPRPAAVRRRR